MTTSNAFKPLTKDDIADVLGVSQRTIENWVSDGTLPAPKKLGNRVYWHPNVFYGWLEGCLTADDSANREGAQTDSAVLQKPEKTKLPIQSKTARHELDKLRNRAQAKLDAIAGAASS